MLILLRRGLATLKQHTQPSIWLFTGITLIAVWVMVAALAMSLRHAALDKTRSDAHNLSAAFGEEVRHVMNHAYPVDT